MKKVASRIPKIRKLLAQRLKLDEAYKVRRAKINTKLGLLASQRDLNLLTELEFLDSLPREMTEWEKAKRQDLTEQLSTDPPFRRVCYPKGVKPFPAKLNAEQLETVKNRQLSAALDQLDVFMEGCKFPAGTTFAVKPFTPAAPKPKPQKSAWQKFLAFFKRKS
jgi:hypothetical protein